MADESTGLPPCGSQEDPNLPRAIEKLPDETIHRIAAGEVVVRPCNALKELLENSLDANATAIQIQCKQGGLKSLQITDNGHGIRREDLERVCERFTTSKLRKYNDLQTIGTYGFRGEALASISHVSRVTITTMTANSQVGHTGKYVNSKLLGSVKPCAAPRGTTICYDDLFLQYVRHFFRFCCVLVLVLWFLARFLFFKIIIQKLYA